MERPFRFLRSLAPGDAAIAGLLALIVLVASFVGLAHLLRTFQVTLPAHGGGFTEGVVGSPRFVNPLLAVSDSDRDLVALTYAGLLGHAADGKIVPVLAESYDVSSDGTIYTFTLRPDATFSDGTPVTADDVVYTVQKAQDPAIKSPLYASWARIRAEALDSRTVRFTLPKAYQPFLEDATLGILPKHLWQPVNAEEFPFAPYNMMPVGAGPFTVTKVARDGSGTITGYSLASSPSYALGRPYLSHIYFRFYGSEDDLIEAYRTGVVDSTYGSAGPDTIAVPYARVFGVFFNPGKNAALEETGVRKALSLAIDRTALTRDVLGGYATPLAGPLPAGSGIPALPLPSDSTRLDEARAALKDAGYAYDEGTKSWTKGGERLSITLTTSNVPELKAVAAQVQKDWQALGVPVELELHDPSTLTQGTIRPRAYEALLFGEVIGTTPDLFAFWSGTERTDPGLNIASFQNEEVDTLLTKARGESDLAARVQLLGQAQEKIAAAYPAAFLYTPEFLYDAPAHISGIRLSQVSSPADRFWGVADWYRYTEHVWPVFVPDAR